MSAPSAPPAPAASPVLSVLALLALLAGGAGLPLLLARQAGPQVAEAPLERPGFPEERRLANVRQLTFAGENAEAYWSFDETRLVFQSTRGTLAADQIYVMDADGRRPRLVSTGYGRTTCAYFLPGDERILFASTHAAGRAPPPGPTPEQRRRYGYLWSIFTSYDVYTARPDGSDVRPLIVSPGYDAEATVSPAGDRIVFTSSRDGDLDLYSCALDGSDVRRLTDQPGYDGGAFYSWDGRRIVWRAPPQEHLDAQEFRELLAMQLVRPSRLELFVMDADGAGARQVTRLGGANFAPFWHPDGRRIIFSSNHHDPDGANFDLFLLTVDTGAVERVTFFERAAAGGRRHSDDFDGFPMFTRDGRRLVWCSNRFNARPNETNVFVADWVD